MCWGDRCMPLHPALRGSGPHTPVSKLAGPVHYSLSPLPSSCTDSVAFCSVAVSSCNYLRGRPCHSEQLRCIYVCPTVLYEPRGPAGSASASHRACGAGPLWLPLWHTASAAHLQALEAEDPHATIMALGQEQEPFPALDLAAKYLLLHKAWNT